MRPPGDLKSAVIEGMSSSEPLDVAAKQGLVGQLAQTGLDRRVDRGCPGTASVWLQPLVVVDFHWALCHRQEYIPVKDFYI